MGAGVSGIGYLAMRPSGARAGMTKTLAAVVVLCVATLVKPVETGK